MSHSFTIVISETLLAFLVSYNLKRLVDALIPKFPNLPAEIIPNIVKHWGHVGYY